MNHQNIGMKNMEELEKRVRSIETQLAMWKGAFIVASICILAWVGVTAWVTLPREVNRQVAQRIGPDIDAKLKAINDQFATVSSNKEQAAKDLGITDIKAELERHTAWIVYTYKTANDDYGKGEGKSAGPILWQQKMSDKFDVKKQEIKF
jgi:hypothetical protein